MEMKSIERPNFTMVPNILLDNMFELTHTEFKVAMLVCRHTFGYHREKKQMSLSYIEKGCGLSRNTVINCLQKLAASGLIIKSKRGESFEFELNVQPSKVVQNLNHPSAKFEPVVVQNLNPINKVVKETFKINDGINAARYGFYNVPSRDQFDELLEYNEFFFVINHKQSLYGELVKAGWKDRDGSPIKDLVAYIRPVEQAIHDNP